MRNIKLILISLILLASGAFVSCSKFLDVNTNPNVATEASEDLILSGLLGNFSFEIIGQGARETSQYMQQIASHNVSPNEDHYVDPFKGTSGIWGYAYTDVLKNAKILDEQATEHENYNHAAIAKTIKAWTFFYLTNLWGPIPFTEATLAEGNTKPKYDDQETVYLGVLGILDDALADLGKTSITKPSQEHDHIYHGDMDKWKKLIYTLKAAVEINLTEAPGYSDTDQAGKALTALSNGFQNNDDNAVYEYYSNLGAQNPYYQWAIDDKWHDYYPVSKHFIDLLTSLNDPRMPMLAAKTKNNGDYVGFPNGADETSALLGDLSEIGPAYASTDSPLLFLTYDEALFIKAEATFRTNGASAAQSVFEDAVSASMERLGVASGDIATYIAALPDLSASADPLEEIIVQKYIAGFLNISVYNDWRRTGFPALTPVSRADGAVLDQIPYRLPWVQSEQFYNNENMMATGIPFGTSGMVVKMWWQP